MKTKILFHLQLILLYLSSFYFKFFFNFILANNRQVDSWIIGVEDVANISNNLLKIIPNSKSAIIYSNKYYSTEYAFAQRLLIKASSFRFFYWIIPPIYLAFLSAKYNKFFYVGAEGFLVNSVDGRFNEFRFLKRSGAVIVCYFTGNDIRSPEKTLKRSRTLNKQDTINFHRWITPSLFTKEYDLLKRKVAFSADTYADRVFNHKLDHISYLKCHQYPIIYFLPDDNFRKSTNKFAKANPIKILHSPSSPVIKGTQVIQMVIRQLMQKGFEFEYVELTDVPNSKVIDELTTSQIVINELYSHAPGIFALEALATYNCVLTSADFRIDPSIPKSHYRPWVIVRPENLFEKLKYLLSDPEKIEFYAEQGFEWASKYVSSSYAHSRFHDILSEF